MRHRICVWPPLMQQQHERTRRQRHLIENFPTTETKSLNSEPGHSLPPFELDGGRATAPSRHGNRCNTPQTSLPVGTASRCRRNHSSAGGSKKFKLLFCAQYEMTTMTLPPSPVNRSHLCIPACFQLPASAFTTQLGDFVSQFCPSELRVTLRP